MARRRRYGITALRLLALLAAAVCVGVGVSVVAPPALAAPPAAPMNPWGTTLIGGNAVPEGTSVEAFVSGRRIAVMEGGTKLGNYSLTIPEDDPSTLEIDGATSGQNLTIKIGGLVVSQTPQWTAGDASQLDLTVVVRLLVVDDSTPACRTGDADFSTISAAVSNANALDTVRVCPGSYVDDVVVDKSISVLGEDLTVTTLTVSSTSYGFYVDADDVTIEGFTILPGSQTNTTGIEVFTGDRARILHNKVKGHVVGINVGQGVVDAVVEGNTVSSSRDAGIRIGGSCDVIGNEVLYTADTSNVTTPGISVGQSGNRIIGNEVGWNEAGIFVFVGGGNEILQNVVRENTIAGILLDNTTGNIILSNDIVGNAVGVRLRAGATSNTIEQNAITGSTTWALENDQAQAIAAERNYWGLSTCTSIDGAIFDDEEGQGAVSFDPILPNSPLGGSGLSPAACQGTTFVVKQVDPICTVGDVEVPDITSALGAAVDGDHIIVCPGLYEENLVVNKSVRISAHGGPSVTTVESCTFRDAVLGCQGFGHIFQIQANGVVLEGFELTGTLPSPHAAVYLVGTQGSEIRGNKIQFNDIGVLVRSNASGNTIVDNEFSNNGLHADDPAGAQWAGPNVWSLFPTIVGTNIIGGTILGGNFWDDYLNPPPPLLPGGDTNNDGIGDVNVPYQSIQCIAPAPCTPMIQVGGDYAPLVP